MVYHFSKASYLNAKYSNNIANGSLDSLKHVDRAKPNIVIIEIVERSYNDGLLDAFLRHFLSTGK